MQTTDTVIMVRPNSFKYNKETAKTNGFMKTLDHLNKELGTNYLESDVWYLAMKEFYLMTLALRNNAIFVAELCSPSETPDAVFPNNWFSLHTPATLVIYPMEAVSRRRERQVEKLLECLRAFHHPGTRVITLVYEEKSERFLEGTGSMVLDRTAKVAYAIESPRTHRGLFEKWCGLMEHEPIFFHAFDKENKPLYHTNVVMGIGDRFAVVCYDAIHARGEQLLVERRLRDADKAIIPISMNQMYAFCGNLLQVRSTEGRSHIVLSSTAFNAFDTAEKNELSLYGNLVPVNIPIIEGLGGGSARCMMAEVF